VNAIELLENQHREVEALFEQIENAEGKEKKPIFEEIRRQLELHTKLEEKIFYPQGMEVDEDVTREAYEEHVLVKDLLKKISHLTPSDETYDAKVTVLKEIVEHHVEEEEEEYFPECKKEWGDVKLQELGAKMEQMMGREETRPTSKKKKRPSTKRKAA
jgi:Hemerythrin HHE cation binding domain